MGEWDILCSRLPTSVHNTELCLTVSVENSTSTELIHMIGYARDSLRL